MSDHERAFSLPAKANAVFLQDRRAAFPFLRNISPLKKKDWARSSCSVLIVLTVRSVSRRSFSRYLILFIQRRMHRVPGESRTLHAHRKLSHAGKDRQATVAQ